ncbi:unnamed protein product [Cuscuta campestris]|uniref:Uncharacterized protein n=1 Tax=Cuscuta campestris TaxID=132261 RepID=A0A484MLZ0_9ASTE|nr:unnamed protein product [Cuscuta campestris]
MDGRKKRKRAATAVEEAPAIGIDLGTTYSCVGVWLPQHHRVEIIPNDLGNRTTPSWVAFTDVQRFVGESAQNQAHMNPSHTIFDVKRLMGRKFSDASVQNDLKLWPFKVIPGADGGSGGGKKRMISVTYKGEEKLFAAEEISSMILQKMKNVAEAYLGKKVKNAVITVPAYFNDAQRQATKDAAFMAGLNVLSIINEPIAAAIAYGLDKKGSRSGGSASKNILVFDLGGGTFDVSIVTIKKGVFEVKAVNGHAHLGGEDFNKRMVSHFVAEFERKHNKDLSGDPRALGRLRTACERAKRFLSATTETSLDIDCLFEGIDFCSAITRARFEDLNMDLFGDCMALVENCLKDAKMEKRQIHDIVLVGGSSRIPKVEGLLQGLFPRKKLWKSINPDEAVACGAALHAASLTSTCSGLNKDVVPVGVAPLSLGVAVCSGALSVVIPRNSTIPTKVTKNFVTASDNQTGWDIKVYEGDMPMAKDNNFLVKFTLNGIPPAPKGFAQFQVTFEVDANGTLAVSAKLEGSNNTNQVTITNHSARLSNVKVDRKAKEAKARGEERKRASVAKRALENYIHYAKGTLGGCGNMARTKDKIALSEAIERTVCWLEWNHLLRDALKFEEKRTELEAICVSVITKMTRPRQGSYGCVKAEIIKIEDD